MTVCPEPGCGLPAEVTETFVLQSTAGPLLHATVRCIGGHHLTIRIGD